MHFQIVGADSFLGWEKQKKSNMTVGVEKSAGVETSLTSLTRKNGEKVQNS